MYIIHFIITKTLILDNVNVHSPWLEKLSMYQSTDVLKAQLAEIGVEFSERLFKSEDGISGLNGLIFVSGIHIIMIVCT